MVQRYNAYGLDWSCETYEDNEGPLVTYEDYQKLEAELESLRQQLKAEMPEPDGGWIEWGGGECPISDLTMVDVRYGDTVALNKPAVSYNWLHDDDDCYAIVAYRIV